MVVREQFRGIRIEFQQESQSEEEIRYFEEIGVQVVLCVGNHHRKLAILDRNVLWEGSLNISTSYILHIR